MKTISKVMAATWVAGFMVAGAVVMAQDLPQIFHINPARSSAGFSIPASGEQANGKPNPTVNGTLQVQKSTVRFIENTGAMSGQVVLGSASENSGSHKRDVAIRTEVLESPQYGTITFTPTKYEGTVNRTGDSEIQVSGTVTLLGQEHPVKMPVKVQSNGFECTATGQLVVPSAQWGIRDMSVAGLNGAKEVDVTLKLVGYLGPRN